MKTCTRCGSLRADANFAKKRNGTASWCKACHRKYTHDHYKANKKYFLERNKKARDKKYAYVLSVKDVPCVDCGVKYPHYVMEFDHTRGVKYGGVSRLASFSWKTLLAEIAKCDVVCANCHCVRTYERRNNMPT